MLPVLEVEYEYLPGPSQQDGKDRVRVMVPEVPEDPNIEPGEWIVVLPAEYPRPTTRHLVTEWARRVFGDDYWIQPREVGAAVYKPRRATR